MAWVSFGQAVARAPRVRGPVTRDNAIWSTMSPLRGGAPIHTCIARGGWTLRHAAHIVVVKSEYRATGLLLGDRAMSGGPCPVVRGLYQIRLRHLLIVQGCQRKSYYFRKTRAQREGHAHFPTCSEATVDSGLVTACPLARTGLWTCLHYPQGRKKKAGRSRLCVLTRLDNAIARDCRAEQ